MKSTHQKINRLKSAGKILNMSATGISNASTKKTTAEEKRK